MDAYCGFRDTSSVTAREIASDGELQAIAAAGVGFVITPFNRRWHAAACPHVQTMTVGTRKWFAATPAELADYLQARIPVRHGQANRRVPGLRSRMRLEPGSSDMFGADGADRAEGQVGRGLVPRLTAVS